MSGLADAKGAPEAVARLCRLTSEEHSTLVQHLEALAARGERVLGVARSQVGAEPLPDAPEAFSFEMLGLVGFEDRLRPGVPEAVAEAREAGVRTVMITGDAPATAREIARQAGLGRTVDVMIGAEIDALSDAALAQAIREVDVFARVLPEHKLRIVEALRQNNEITAMTGDGVNDAPALSAADVGIAMGERGTDVAREAAALVLLDDDFSSIVAAIRGGRRVFDNLRRAVVYIFAVHVPIAGLSLVPLAWKGLLILQPVHIVLLEMVIDPACSFVFESAPEERDIMRRPPRSADVSLFDTTAVLRGLSQGATVLLACLLVYGFATSDTPDPDRIRTMTFTALLLCNVSLVLANHPRRSRGEARSDARVWALVGGVAGMLALAIYQPTLSTLCHFTPLRAHDWVPSLLGALGTWGAMRMLPVLGDAAKR
ncbi:MAG: cation-translocating P-type ATPase [Proteobacteria bacterium]|nr:cation-translocating P-type ATPase [Pseudomonadota bacterium]